MEWVESTGRSIADAKEAALDRLGVHEDDAEFDVLSDARVGLFGRVKEDARVRARVRPTVPRSKDDRRRRGRRSGPGDGRSRGRGKRDRTNGSGREGDASQARSERNGGSKRRADGGGRQGEASGDRSSKRIDKGSGGRDRDDKGSAGRDRNDKGSGRDTRGKGRNDKGSGGNVDRDTRGKGRNDKGSGGNVDRDVKGEKGRNDSSTARAGGRKKESSVSEHDNGPSLMEQAVLAEEFVGGLADAFGMSLEFERDELKDGILRIEASGDDIGVLVGRRGATAQAIDDLVRTVLQRAGGTTREGKIRVDIGGVRARRTASLTEFCQKVAAEVVETGREALLEPMGGADRKLVHDVVSAIEGVETRSEGEDPNRRVVIVPSGDA